MSILLTGVTRCNTSPSMDSTALMVGFSEEPVDIMLFIAPNSDIRCGWMELTDVGLLRMLSSESSET